MPIYAFKLLGGYGDRAEIDISLDPDLNVKEVKEIVRKEFRIIPNIKIELMVNGKTLSDDLKWGTLDIKPMKTKILVIGHRND